MDGLPALLLLAVVGVLYFFPSYIAISRQENPAPAVIVNLFFGWTFVGWVIALAMAASGESRDDSTASVPTHESNLKLTEGEKILNAEAILIKERALIEREKKLLEAEKKLMENV